MSYQHNDPEVNPYYERLEDGIIMKRTNYNTWENMYRFRMEIVKLKEDMEELKKRVEKETEVHKKLREERKLLKRKQEAKNSGKLTKACRD